MTLFWNFANFFLLSTGNEGKDGYSANATYEAPEQAQQAIKQLNRYNLDGSVLKVRYTEGKGRRWSLVEIVGTGLEGWFWNHDISQGFLNKVSKMVKNAQFYRIRVSSSYSLHYKNLTFRVSKLKQGVQSDTWTSLWLGPCLESWLRPWYGLAGVVVGTLTSHHCGPCVISGISS